jgi:DNA-binding NarL/FixJ family response regulator
LDIVVADAGTDFAGSDLTRNCGLAVLNVGATDVDFPDVRHWINQIRTSLPNAPLVILSDDDRPQQVIAAFRAGAGGFIPTTFEPLIALQALSFILSGGSFFPPTALDAVSRMPEAQIVFSAPQSAQAETSRVSAGGSGLTTRQQQVLGLLRTGKSNKLIARELSMQESTVKVHVRQIMRKFGAANRTQVALCAVETGGSMNFRDEGPAGRLHSYGALTPKETV